MSEGRDGLLRLSLHMLDVTSQRRVRIFLVKLVIVVPAALLFAAPRGYPPLRALAFFCGCQSLFSGLTALFQRQRCDAACLTAWDETAAFLAVTELARIFGAVAG
jgi:hypothetical protein